MFRMKSSEVNLQVQKLNELECEGLDLHIPNELRAARSRVGRVMR
jgi:hypothetical protein